MSGSPLSQKATSEASERTHLSTGYPTTIHQDAYRGISTQPSPAESQHSHGYPSTSDPYRRSHPHDLTEKMDHGYPRPTGYPPRPLTFPPQTLPSVSQAVSQHPPYLSATAPPTAPGYPLVNRPHGVDSQPFHSPKSQRKAKGHVASACVPCKRAHLRCDAQRPCSRCLGSGKEDACVDVQHKKRGRPRLRDEKEARFDLSRPPAPHEAAMRRPLSVYPPGGPTVPGYELPPHDSHSQRVLKPQPRESLVPRYTDHQSPRDMGPYNLGPSSAAQPPEYVAYLSLDMGFSRASEPFLDALGGLRNRRLLEEVVVPGERDKVLGLKNRILAEQKQREPNYLPPILDRGDQILQGLGFGAADLSRFHLNHQDYLTFVTTDGHPRVYPVRLGLAKEGSFFFVVLVLIFPRSVYSSTSQHDRNLAPSFYGQPSATHTNYSHPPGSMAHDLNRHRLNDGPLASRPPPGIPSQMRPGQNPGIGGIRTSYSVSPNRPEYAAPAYHAPRNELGPGSQQPPHPSYQLPPIRAPPEKDVQGGEPPSRVAIGGLIENPEAPGRSH